MTNPGATIDQEILGLLTGAHSDEATIAKLVASNTSLVSTVATLQTQLAAEQAKQTSDESAIAALQASLSKLSTGTTTAPPTGGTTTVPTTTNLSYLSGTYKSTLLYDFTTMAVFPAADFSENRWDGPLPTLEQTNNPSIQDDYSDSRCCYLSNGRLCIDVRLAFPESTFGKKWAGGHFQGKNPILANGQALLVRARINKCGATWPGLVCYGAAGKGGELDIEEDGDTSKSDVPTDNVHQFTAAGQDTGNQQFSYPSTDHLVGDGKVHDFVTVLVAPNTVQFWLDGVLLRTGTQLDSASFTFAVEVGVPAGGVAVPGTVVELFRLEQLTKQ